MMTAKRFAIGILKYGVLILFALWSAVPVLLIILNSFKRKLDIFTNPPSLVFEPTLSNYKKIFLTDDYLSYYLNSIAITGMTTVLSILFGLLAAYGIVYFGLKHGNKVANIFLWVKMIPPITMLLPMYSMLTFFDLQGTYVGPVLAHTSLNLAFVIWLFMSLLKEVPSEIIRFSHDGWRFAHADLMADYRPHRAARHRGLYRAHRPVLVERAALRSAAHAAQYLHAACRHL